MSSSFVLQRRERTFLLLSLWWVLRLHDYLQSINAGMQQGRRQERRYGSVIKSIVVAKKTASASMASRYNARNLMSGGTNHKKKNQNCMTAGWVLRWERCVGAVQLSLKGIIRHLFASTTFFNAPPSIHIEREWMPINRNYLFDIINVEFSNAHRETIPLISCDCESRRLFSCVSSRLP